MALAREADGRLLIRLTEIEKPSPAAELSRGTDEWAEWKERRSFASSTNG